MQPILPKDSTNEWDDKEKHRFSFHSRVQPILSKVVPPIFSYGSIPTSNRNPQLDWWAPGVVVYRSIPTSDRNVTAAGETGKYVVYRSIPTSNRNWTILNTSDFQLYIVLFPHQPQLEPGVELWLGSDERADGEWSVGLELGVEGVDKVGAFLYFICSVRAEVRVVVTVDAEPYADVCSAFL